MVSRIVYYSTHSTHHGRRMLLFLAIVAMINELIIMGLIVEKIVLVREVLLLPVLWRYDTHWISLIALNIGRWIVDHLNRLHLHLSSINFIARYSGIRQTKRMILRLKRIPYILILIATRVRIHCTHLGHSSRHFLIVWVMLFPVLLFDAAATAASLPVAAIEVDGVDYESEAADAAKDVHHDSDDHLFRRPSIAIFFTRFD